MYPPKVCALHPQKVTDLCLLTRAKQTRVEKISTTITVALAGVSGISSVSGGSRERCGMAKAFPYNPTASFVQPLSLASARQLPWQGSPWQRGFVFDETDWGLLENVTECQSLSLWERWHCEAMTERARMLTKSKKHSDTSPVCQRHRIAVLSCFILPGLPSQTPAAPAPPKGEPLAKRFRFR